MLRAVMLLAATFLALIYWPTMNAELQADELLSLIAAVEENERLYSNIDIKVQFAYEAFRRSSKNTTTEYEEMHRYVNSGNRFYALVENSSRTKTKFFISFEERSFDGKQTSIQLNDQVADIHQGRYDDSIVLLPHMLLLHHGSTLLPLSVYLRGTNATAAQSPTGMSPERKASTEYLGVVSVDGLRCHRVAVSSNGGESRRDFWLAEDRNYLVVKTKSYIRRVDPFIPVSEGHVAGFQQTESDVWLPESGIYTLFDKAVIDSTGESIPSWKHTFRIVSATLNPEYPDEFFESKKVDGGMAMPEPDHKSIPEQ